MQRKHPSRAAQHTLVGNGAFPEIVPRALQRNRKAVGGDDGFQMRANVKVQGVETIIQVLMIVKRQSARMRIERKRAQRAAQPRELHIKLLRVATLGETQVAQRSEAGVD